MDAPSHAVDPLEAFKGSVVICDTQGPLMYIGTLAALHAAWLELHECDVHDRRDGRATKDLYLVETRDLGVRANRTRVLVYRRDVASISLLADVKAD